MPVELEAVRGPLRGVWVELVVLGEIYEHPIIVWSIPVSPRGGVRVLFGV